MNMLWHQPSIQHLTEKKDWNNIKYYLSMENAKDWVERESQDGSSILSFVVERQPPLEIVQLITAVLPTAPSQKDKSGQLPLHRACAFGTSSEIIAHLVNEYLDGVIAMDEDGRLPIHHAVERACMEVDPLEKSHSQDGEYLSIFEILLRSAPESVYTTDTSRQETPLDIALRISRGRGKGRNGRATAVKQSLRSISQTDTTSRTKSKKSSRYIKISYHHTYSSHTVLRGQAA